MKCQHKEPDTEQKMVGGILQVCEICNSLEPLGLLGGSVNWNDNQTLDSFTMNEPSY